MFYHIPANADVLVRKRALGLQTRNISFTGIQSYLSSFLYTQQPNLVSHATAELVSKVTC
jgi:hypothetical protein